MSQRKAPSAAKPAALRRRKTHFMSPKLEIRMRPEKGGYGVFSTQPVMTGEILVVWGGMIMPGELLGTLNPTSRRHSIQVEENLFLVPSHFPEPADFVNHSCEPNAGLSGQSGLVSLRRVNTGEEICYDYAMSDGSPYDEFACQCGARSCRGRVTGHDWALPELQRRYGGYFSPYLQRRIDEAREIAALHLPQHGMGMVAESPRF